MIVELSHRDYDRVRPLFRALEYHLSSAAVLDGNNPGLVLVDDPVSPQSAFMLSPEGCYLAGDPGNDAFNRALNKAIRSRRIIDQQVLGLCFVCWPESWRQQLARVLQPGQPTEIPRRHYVCRQLRYDWRAHVPASFAVHRLDGTILESANLTIPSHIKGWIDNNWGSTADFMQKGFGFVTLHIDADRAQVVSWSLADCRSGAACEIGIRTAQEFRRRGLATITTAAAVEYALSHGFSMVGWQCSEDNPGSFGTAEKVGFEHERNYTLYCASLVCEGN